MLGVGSRAGVPGSGRDQAYPSLWGVAPPAVALLPCQRVRPGDVEAQVQLREVDSELIVTAYSSVAALVRCCGPDQPWVALAATDVEQLRTSTGATAVLLDLPLTAQR